MSGLGQIMWIYKSYGSNPIWPIIKKIHNPTYQPLKTNPTQ